MRTILFILLALDMIAVVVVMLIGAIGMADLNRSPRTSNRLMRLRVILQGVAIALVVVLMLSGR
ncbi:MAG TPA: HIG1 domain-containing protein [Acidocella sp.]|uniref:HIG1 domain-containing protein n=1 Tax=Acidocella sp. TaxID=50710 RepID=UPI002C308928|nr:HIG1 domain-containing protein [Acidocella sp.]HVE21551.1 HIG1 domain-containing protein [Acidocella sp.]